ncbi:MAG: molybdate ABC transporter permease subunit, partial [Acidobacteria bacterium]
MNWEAVFTSLKLASATTLILFILGLPLASWLAFSKWRWKFLLESV